LIGWRLIFVTIRKPALWHNNTPTITAEQLDSLMTWIIIGIVLGGRLGSVLFYNPAYYLENPLEIPQVWNGGMSFHGGFLGVVLAIWMFARKHKLAITPLADVFAMGTPAGLLLGRIANFINAELWGRPTDAPWGVMFPGIAAQDCGQLSGPCARHPSQLYEAGLEGLLLGALLLILVWRFNWLKIPGQTAGLFFAGYGVSRFFVEFFRQADAQYITLDNPFGYVLRAGEMGISMGQLLSLPMIVVGIWVVIWARKNV
jgi:phosphatidylglycerol:prolipoprotein diacylglycerol transferase